MSAKKKRMGSHRRSNQNKMDTESLHVEGSASAAELIQEEKSETDLLASPDCSQSETQHSPSSEMTGHRRKLGSSRSRKGRGHVKESFAESGHKPREEVEEDTKDNETLEINMSIETPRYRDLNNPSDGNSSLFSLPVPDVMDVLISRSENQQEAHNERETDSGLVSDFHKLEELESVDVSLTQESGDVTSENAHYVDLFTSHTSPAFSKSTHVEVSDNASSVYSLTEKQNRERDDADLVRQGKPLHAKPFRETEAAESSITSELSTKENVREHSNIECSVEQEIHLDEEQSELINLSQVEGAHQSEDDLTEREAEAAQMQDVQHVLVSSESVTNEAGGTSDTSSVKLTEQLELRWVYRDEDQVEDDIKPTAEQAVHHEMKDSRKESSLETPYTEMNAPLTSQDQNIFVRAEKQPDTDFHPIVSRRKLGSSRRSKGRQHVKDSAAESQNQNVEGDEENRDNETGGTTEMPSSDEVVMQEETVKTVLEGMDTSEAITDEVKNDAYLADISELIQFNVQSGPTVDQQLIDQSKPTEMAQEELHSVDSATDPQYKEKDEETEASTHDGDGDISNLESKSHVKSEDVEFLQIQEATVEKPSLREHIKVEYSVDQEILSLPQEEVNLNQDENEHFNLPEVVKAHQSTDVFNDKDTDATKIQDTHPVVVTSETETHESMDSSDISSIKLTDQDEICDTYQLTIKSTDDSSTQQDVSSPDNKNEQSIKHSMLETLDHKKDDYNTREPQISDLGSRDTEVGQVYDVQDQFEGDLKPTTEEVVHDELKEVPFDDVDRDSSLPTTHTEMNAPLASQHQDMLDKQPDTDFHPIVSRRKLGSSRRSKGRHHVKDSAAESQNQNVEGDEENADNKTGGTTEMPSSDEVVMQEETVETVLEGMDTSEAITDEVKDDAHLVDIPELIHLNVQSGPTVDQQLIDQSKSTEMAQEELHSVDSATDPQYKEKDEETEASTQVRDLYASNLESESHVKSEDVEVLLTQDVTAEKPSLSEHIESVLTEVDTSANASDEVKDAIDLVSIVNVESSPTAYQQLFEIENSADEEKMSLPLAEDAYLNESEIGGAHQSNTEATKIQDMPQVVVRSEPLTHEATHSFDTFSLNLSDTELGQVQKDEDQAEDDLKPATEDTVHHELKEAPSEDVDRDSSLPTVHTEINAPLASQHQDMLDKQPNTDFHPIVSRRKLGSSQRNKGKHHVKDSAAESQNQNNEEVQENRDNKTGGTTEMPSTDEVVMQEKTVETVLEGMDTSEAITDEVKDDAHLVDIPELIHLNVQSGPTVDQQLIDQSKSTEMAQEELCSVDSATDPQYKEKDEETEVSTPGGDLYASNLESESHVKSEDVEVLLTQDITAEKPSLSEHIESVLTEVDTSANASDKVKDTIDLVSIVNVESSPTAYQQLFEIENSADGEKTSLPLAEDAYLNESEIGGAHQSNTEATKIQDMPQVVVTSKPLTHEATHSFDTSTLNLSDTELGQVQKDEDQAEDDLKPATEDTVHHEQEKQSHMTSRRKFGSSRRIKQRQHVKDSAESLEEIKEDIRGNKDSHQTEVSEIRDNFPLAGTSEINNSSVQSSLPVEPQLADQTNTREMPHEDLHSVDSAPEGSTKREEETGTAKQDGNVQANNLVKESRIKSEEKVEITIENISFGENTTQESNVNEAFVSLQKDLTTNEQQNRLLSSSGLTVPQNLEDKVSEADEEIKTPLQNTQPEMHIQLSTQPLGNPQNIHPEQTQTSIETIEDGGTKKPAEVRENHKADAEGSMNVNVPGHDEFGLQHEAPAVKETHALDEFTHTELFPVPHSETKTVAQLDTFREENISAEASMEENSISEGGDECKDQGTPDQSGNLQIKPQQKRRKMGSTRRSQMKRKQEGENETEDGNFHTDIDVRDHEKTKVVEELPEMLMEKLNENEKPLQSETQKESSALEEEHKSQSNETIDLMAAVPLQVPPHGEAVVNPVMFANAASVSSSEKNEDVILNTSQPVDFTSAEIHIPSVVVESSSISMNQILSTNTENAGITSVYEMSQSTQNDDKIPESLRKKECEDSIEQKALKSAEFPTLEIVKEEAGGGNNNTLDNMREQNILHEGASNINTETKNESPDLNSTNRRRKMGSTRRSLGTRPKREDLSEKQADNTEDAETTVNAGDVMTQSICGIKEEELQLQTEHKDGVSDRGTDKGFETVDYSNTGDTCKTSVPQQLDDENPVSKGSLEDFDQLISDDLPEKPAASSNIDAMSDPAVGGRRRKMGSHRRSRGAQTPNQGEITDTQNGSDGRIVKDESVMKTAENKLDKITEVNESYTNPFSISTPSTSQTLSEKPSERVSPAQHLYPDVQLSQERQKKLSLGYARGANPSDDMYDVVMIGDSCVGKTSFMKRAQSGKFSLDLPASVGLDSCIWTVIVDGKTVVLHLWDTAGQERFHSLTRQTFHKAQAFLLMYDVSSPESFSAVSYWVNCIKEGAAEDVIVLLLGNKCDHTKRQVQIQQGENLAKEYNFDFMECSAATGENVIESLETVARLLSQKAVTTEETVVLLKESKPKNKSGCC
ncbi:uncharacterized protein rab44 [Sphaeramia orbicularis]|nr:uncharacterized protein LOC115419352 [Sphaeramia orbicularis]